MLYTLDDYNSGQLVKDIFRRVVLANQTKELFSAYDLYDVKENETPEILANKIYGSAHLHWVLLLTNDIIDPRYDWPMSTINLIEYVKHKYHSIRSKYIRFNNNKISALDTNTIKFVKTLSVNDSLEIIGSYNKLNDGIYTVSSLASSGESFTVTDTLGNSVTFSDDNITSKNLYVKLLSDHSGEVHHYEDTNGREVQSPGSSITPISNYTYEERINEGKRRIKILQPRFISQLQQELQTLIKPR
jgi:hypothetical protein